MIRVPHDIVAELKSIPVERVAEELGLDVKRHSALCFMHDDHHPSLVFNVKANAWRCYACDKGGSTITLVMAYFGVGFHDACSWMCERFLNRTLEDQVFLSSKPFKKKDNIKKELPQSLDKEVLDWFFSVAGLSPIAQRFLYDARGYSPEVVSSLGILSITSSKLFVKAVINRFGKSRGISSGLLFESRHGVIFPYFQTPCLIFPYRNLQGEIVSVQSRYLGEKSDIPRFQFLKGSSVHIFNQPVLEGLVSDEPLYIAEGVTDCLALLSMGLKAVAVPGASMFKEADIELLKGCHLRMYPDNDEAGKRLYSRLRTLFASVDTEVEMLSLPDDCKDVSDFFVKYKKKGITV